ncbi:MAG: DUF2029 domain-containing protein [Flavobacteriales bacterium]|nr:DUF2029 domain-containing protein [Flavobacteriales bacterium]
MVAWSRDRASWLLLALLAFQLATALGSIWTRNDLDIFLAAAQDLLQGSNVYRASYNDCYSYFYGLAFAYLLAPLTALPIWMAKVLWSLAGLFLVGRCYQIMAGWLGLHAWPLARQRLVQVLVALVTLQSLRDNLGLGQASLLLCWCGLESIALAARGRALPAAMLLSFGIDMKLLPLIVLPYWIYRAHWRATVLLPICLAAWVVLPLGILGVENGKDLLSTRWQLLDPSDTRHVLDDEEHDFIALGSVISAYLGGPQVNDHRIDLPRRVASLPDHSLGLLTWAARLLLGLGMLWFLRTLPFRGPHGDLHRAWETAYLLACIPLVFPHQQNYATWYAAPAILYLAVHTIANPARGPWLIAAWVMLFLGMNVHLLLGHFGWFYDHYKVLSVSLLFTLIWLGRSQPDHLLVRMRTLQE